jgi:sporulation protein YlmC with PRC-barrel domain
MAQGGMPLGQFMTGMQGSQMLASKLIGTTVVSANNESIGDVNDVVLDGDGRAMAVVVGVGGFLGIGEKDVAVPYGSLQFASREQMNAMNNQKSGGSASSGTTATSNSNVNATGSTSSTMNGNGGPDRIVLYMTKEQLKAAPSFYTSARGGDNAAGGTANAPAGAATAPKQ